MDKRKSAAWPSPCRLAGEAEVRQATRAFSESEAIFTCKLQGYFPPEKEQCRRRLAVLPARLGGAICNRRLLVEDSEVKRAKCSVRARRSWAAMMQQKACR